jgi:hypothetical protein
MENEDYEDHEDYDNQSESSFEDEDLVGGAYNSMVSHSAGRRRGAVRASEKYNGSGLFSSMLPGPLGSVAGMFGLGHRRGRKPRGGINPMRALKFANQALPLAQGLKGLFGLGHGKMSKKQLQHLHQLHGSGLFSSMLPGPLGSVAGMFGLGHPHGHHHGSGLFSSMLPGPLGSVAGMFGLGHGKMSKKHLQHLHQLHGSGLFSSMLPGPLGSVAGMFGLGHRRGRKPRGGAWYNNFGDFVNAGKQGLKYGQDAYNMAGQVTPYLKPLLNQYGGDYGKSASSGLSSIGLGRRGRKARGAGFWDDFSKGFDSTFRPGMAVLKPLMGLAGPEGQAMAGVASALGYGKHRKGGVRSGGARSTRGAIVKHVMNERGCSLAQASKIVKQEGLY